MNNTNHISRNDERDFNLANGHSSSSGHGNTLKHWRSRNHYGLGRPLTQRELARLVGISSDTLSRIERGTSIPSLSTALRLWAALGIPPQAVFTELADQCRAEVERQVNELRQARDQLPEKKPDDDHPPDASVQ